MGDETADAGILDFIDTTGKEIEEYKRRNRKVRRGGKRIKKQAKKIQDPVFKPMHHKKIK